MPGGIYMEFVKIVFTCLVTLALPTLTASWRKKVAEKRGTPLYSQETAATMLKDGLKKAVVATVILLTLFGWFVSDEAARKQYGGWLDATIAWLKPLADFLPKLFVIAMYVTLAGFLFYVILWLIKEKTCKVADISKAAGEKSLEVVKVLGAATLIVTELLCIAERSFGAAETMLSGITKENITSLVFLVTFTAAILFYAYAVGSVFYTVPALAKEVYARRKAKEPVFKKSPKDAFKVLRKGVKGTAEKGKQRG